MANTKRWSERACDELGELKIQRAMDRADGIVTAQEQHKEDEMLDQGYYYAEGAAIVEAENQLATRQGPEARMNTTLRVRFNNWRRDGKGLRTRELLKAA